MPPPPRNVPIPPPSGAAQLDQAEIDRSLIPIEEGLASCVRQYRDYGGISARIVIVATGEVASAEVMGGFNWMQRRCFLRDVRMARFPSFSGPPIEASVELTRASSRRQWSASGSHMVRMVVHRRSR